MLLPICVNLWYPEKREYVVYEISVLCVQQCTDDLYAFHSNSIENCFFSKLLINCESSVIVYTLLLIVSGIFKNLVRKNN